MSKRGSTYRADATPIQAAARPVEIGCRHEHASVGRGCFDYCPDCGAVRSSSRPGEAAGPWHSCAECAL